MILPGGAGRTYRMAVMRDGGIALAHPNTGTWSRVESPSQIKGRPLVEGNIVSDGIKPDVFDAGEVGRNLLVSTDGNSFYLTVADPYYQVVRFRLTGR